MFRNYLKIAFRHLQRHKSYTLINTLGLAVGLAVCLLIGLWIRYELSYDDFHEKGSRIYRVLDENTAATPPPLASALKSDYPDLVKETTRFWPVKSPSDIVYGKQVYAERNITFTDPSVFDVFTHPLIAGDKKTALANPQSIVLSESTAEKYFGDEHPLGKNLNMWGQDLTVTAVFEDVPLNAHHRYDILVPAELLHRFLGDMMQNWRWAGFYTYVLIPEHTKPQQVEAAVTTTLRKYSSEEFVPSTLQPLSDIYFSNNEKDIAVTGNFNNVLILGTIAAFVLIVACINFMNLSTAYSSLRKKEVGMRKALGAGRNQLVTQFLGEAVILSFMALALAFLVVELSLPFFSSFTGKPLAIPYDNGISLLLAFIAIALFAGVAAGSYPAFFLSRFRPIRAFKESSARSSSGGGIFRKSLVVFQFVISGFMIIAASTVYLQLDYMQTKELGFDDEKVLVTEAGDYQLLKQELEKIPDIDKVSAAYSVPGQRFPFYPFRTPGMAPDSLPTMRTLRINPGFIETLGMNMAEGRSFSEDIPTDQTNAFVINRAAVKYLGWENPIGKEISWYDFNEDGTDFEVAKEGKVIGVVDDFNYASLHNPVEPLVIHADQNINWALIRLQTDNIQRTIAQVKDTWNQVSPDRPFWYYFLDQELDRQYGAEQKLGQVFSGLTMLALFIACLGLFGLTAFTTRERTKEIGIRKVMGAGIHHILILLNKDVIKMVLISLCISIPLGWYAMSRWLQEFAFRIDLGAEIFIWTGTSALLVSLLTVSWQSLKAAQTDPVTSIRNE